MQNIPDPVLLTCADVAKKLNVSIRTLKTLIADQQISFVRVGSRGIRFTQADVDNYIAANRVRSKLDQLLTAA